ncbi:MAG: MOSC domain-containing protein [Thermoflexibacter sp.]
MKNIYTLSHIYIYPVKSLGGITLPAAKVEQRGLEHDRRWLLIDKNNRFLTQRENPQMALIQVALTKENLVFAHKNYPQEIFKLPFQLVENKEINVTIWEDTCKANPVSQEADEWFSEALGVDCRLVKMAEDEKRLVDQDYTFKGEVVSFADGYPFLIIGQSSLDDLNSRLEYPVEMRRFRPNFVFEGGLPYEEETWKRFSIGSVDFLGVKPCARCVLTTVNPEKGEIDSKEPLRTLASYRKSGNKILFGQNVLPVTLGEVKIGDGLIINEIAF